MAFSIEKCIRVDRGEVAIHPFTLFSQQEITLKSDDTVKIADLHQFHTYGGMLAGMPHAHTLQFNIDNAVRVAIKVFPAFPAEKFAVFAPVITFGRTLRKMTRDGELQMFPWEMLPKITSIAVLQKTSSFDSVLAIWWQDDLGYPGEDLLASIRTLHWQTHMVEMDP